MQVRYTRAAQSDIQDIFDFIAKENVIAARAVAAAIAKTVGRLERFPMSGRQGAVDGTRELVIPRLPYIVVYVLLAESADIVAVFNAAQDKPRGF